MPIRKSLSIAVQDEDAKLRRAIAAAAKAQRLSIKDDKDFGESEDALRMEYSYLTWLNEILAHDGKLKLART